MAEHETDLTDLKEFLKDFNHFDLVPLEELAERFGVNIREMGAEVLRVQRALESADGHGLLGLTVLGDVPYAVYLHGPNGLQHNPLTSQESQSPDDIMLRLAELIEKPETVA